jgi:hypothetical protein
MAFVVGAGLALALSAVLPEVDKECLRTGSIADTPITVGDPVGSRSTEAA